MGVEPTRRRFTAGSRCRFGFGHSASTRSRTRNAGSARPRDVRFTTEARSSSTPARSRTWICSFGRSRDGSVSPPRHESSGGWSRTNTGGFRARRPAVRRPRNKEQPVGVSIPSPRRERPVTSPDVERAVSSSPGGGRTHSIPRSERGWSSGCLPGHVCHPPGCQRPESARRESNPPDRRGRAAPEPLGHGHDSAEGEGVEPSRLIAHPGSSGVPSPVGLPFRKSNAPKPKRPGVG